MRLVIHEICENLVLHPLSVQTSTDAPNSTFWTFLPFYIMLLQAYCTVIGPWDTAMWPNWSHPSTLPSMPWGFGTVLEVGAVLKSF